MARLIVLVQGRRKQSVDGQAQLALMSVVLAVNNSHAKCAAKFWTSTQLYQYSTSNLPVFYQYSVSNLPVFYQYSASNLPVFYQYSISNLWALFGRLNLCYCPPRYWHKIWYMMLRLLCGLGDILSDSTHSRSCKKAFVNPPTRQLSSVLYICIPTHSGTRSTTLYGMRSNCGKWEAVSGQESIPGLIPLSCRAVARSLVLAGHLLYASPLALRSCARLRDMSGTNMLLWPGTCPARPGLRYATEILYLYTHLSSIDLSLQ